MTDDPRLGELLRAMLGGAPAADGPPYTHGWPIDAPSLTVEGDVMTDTERRAHLADMMEHILTAEDDGWTSTYVDADTGIIDARIEMRPEWVAAIHATWAMDT